MRKLPRAKFIIRVSLEALDPFATADQPATRVALSETFKYNIA